jgi:hypothetical protein
MEIFEGLQLGQISVQVFCGQQIDLIWQLFRLRDVQQRRLSRREIIARVQSPANSKLPLGSVLPDSDRQRWSRVDVGRRRLVCPLKHGADHLAAPWS